MSATSPLIELMRECVATPCRGSDVSSDALIDVVRREIESPARRTGLRSSRKQQQQQQLQQKVVTFDEASLSPTKSARRKRSRAKSMSPRKALSQKDENARPVTADATTTTNPLHAGVVVKQPLCPSSLDASSTAQKIKESPSQKMKWNKEREIALAARVEDLQDDLEERDLEIKRLTQLVEFLSMEVKIYTRSLEQQVEDQRLEILLLKQHASK